MSYVCLWSFLCHYCKYCACDFNNRLGWKYLVGVTFINLILFVFENICCIYLKQDLYLIELNLISKHDQKNL